MIVNLDYAGTARLDACGRREWSLPIGSHHSVERTDAGHFWVPALKAGLPAPHRPARDSFPGLGRPDHQNVAVKITGDGRILGAISALEVLFRNGLERQVARYWHRHEGSDVTHLNDAEPVSEALADDFPRFEAGDLLLSMKYVNLVVVVDPESLEVKWHASRPFIAQHDADYMAGGRVGVYDNSPDGTGRGRLAGGSRIVALKPGTDSTRVLFPTSRSDPFHSYFAGKWSWLENGNLLLTESSAGRIVEVAPDGTTIWEWAVEPYEETRVREVFEGSRYDWTLGRVDGWPCSSVGPRAR